MDARPVLETVAGSGPSPYGISRYTAEVECSRRARLDEADPFEPLSAFGASSVGIIGHKLLEYFHRGHEPSEVLGWEPWIDERARDEAYRVFRAYRKRHPKPGTYGKVLAVEQEIGPIEPNWTGGLPFTCRIDLVRRMTPRGIRALEDNFEVDGVTGALESGIWIWDWKFLARREGNLLDKILHSLQYIAYPLAYQQECGTAPKGTIQITLFKTKEPRFLATVIPFPNEAKQTVLKCWFRDRVKPALEATGERLDYFNRSHGVANPLACFTWGRTCRHLVNGSCTRC